MPFVETQAVADDRRLTLVWKHDGVRTELCGVPGAKCLDVAWDILLLKEVVDAGAGLDPADLHLCSLDGPGPPISQLSGEAREEVAALAFEQLVEQLRTCMRKLQPPIGAPRGPPTDDAELLRAAAFFNHTALLRLLLLLTPADAFLCTPGRMPDVFEEAYSVYGHEGDDMSQHLLGWTAVHTAAAGDSVACASVLLQAEPSLAAIHTCTGWWPAHVAAWHGHTDVLRLLLAAAPDTALASDLDGYLPLHFAALGGWEGCVRVLLAAAPATVDALNGQGDMAIHLGSLCQRPRDPSGSNHVAVVRLLLEYSPEAAAVPGDSGTLPLAYCAGSSSGTADVLQVLLQAYPEAVRVRDHLGCLPSHLAAASGSLAALDALFGAAPQTFVDVSREEGFTPMHHAARNGNYQAIPHLLRLLPISASLVDTAGRLPLTVALQRMAFFADNLHTAPTRANTPAACIARWETVCCLLPTVPAATALSAVVRSHEGATQLMSDAVACHLPLSPAEWLLVPEPCPNLIHALPAALRHSREQAAQLVRRLPPADKARLRTAVLSMARTQKLAEVCLPPLLFERILGLSFCYQ